MKYLKNNVYQETQARLKFIFEEFDNIYISFSGGKDSGILLNLCIDYIRNNRLKRKIGVFHQDFEAQYTATTEYVERTLRNNLDIITPYWVCIPMACKTATSQFEQYWYPWDESKKDLWTREMPANVINIHNHHFDFYKEGITQEDIYGSFGSWYHRHECNNQGKTICLVGIRTQESLNRWRAINADKTMYKNKCYTVKKGDIFNAYPIYDWQTTDVWIANAKFGYDYNKIYDLFHYAGLNIDQMRVASPFNDWAIGSLSMYRIIEPTLWAKFIGRVRGANFSAIYGNTKAVAWKNIDLPEGHTWKSFVEFLLSTLPLETRKSYQEKFATSLEFWAKKGGVLSDETIKNLRVIGIKCKKTKEKSNYKTKKHPVIFNTYPDDAPVDDFSSIPSYKRMAICILKNDHLCKYMGFSQTKEELIKRKRAIEQYSIL